MNLAPIATASGIADPSVLLFSESTTRFLIEVEPENAAKFEAKFTGLPVFRVGVVLADQRIRANISDGEQVLDVDGIALKAAWQKPLAWE